MNPCANRRYPFQNIFLPNHFLLIFSRIFYRVVISWNLPNYVEKLPYYRRSFFLPLRFDRAEGESILAESTVEERRSQFKSSSNYRQILFCGRAFGAITIILHFLGDRFCTENLELYTTSFLRYFTVLNRIFETYIPRNETELLGLVLSLKLFKHGEQSLRTYHQELKAKTVKIQNIKFSFICVLRNIYLCPRTGRSIDQLTIQTPRPNVVI